MRILWSILLFCWHWDSWDYLPLIQMGAKHINPYMRTLKCSSSLRPSALLVITLCVNTNYLYFVGHCCLESSILLHCKGHTNAWETWRFFFQSFVGLNLMRRDLFISSFVNIICIYCWQMQDRIKYQTYLYKMKCLQDLYISPDMILF